MLISTNLAYGGAETQLVRLAIHLKRRGWNVNVVSLIPPQAYVEELGATGIPVFSLDIKRKFPDPRPLLKLTRLIKATHPHIVHSFMVHANLLARFTRLLTPIPILICSVRSIYEGNCFREFLYRLTDTFCDLTTQVSRAGLERYVSKRIVPSHKIRYIPNGVDTEQFKPDPHIRLQVREKLGLEKNFVWLAVGRFDVPKDYPNMLQAFSQVVKEKPESFLLIVGDGLLRRSIEKLAFKLKIDDRVRFLGTRQDIPQLMNAADAYVMSSKWEGMPNVLLEASACGIPIVATNVGGNNEVVLDGRTGFLVPPKDPKALAEAMLNLMSLPEEKRKEMGLEARTHVETNFSLSRVVDLWETLYQELLESKGVFV